MSSAEREGLRLKGNVPNLRFPGFSGEWERIRLAEVSNIKTGPFGSTLHAEDYVSEGTPIITTEHFKNGRLPITKDGLPQVSQIDYQRLKSYRLLKKDIVFSRVGSVDINAIVEGEQEGWLFSGRVLRVRPTEGIDSDFLHWCLSTDKNRANITRRAVGQTMPSINTEILNETELLITKNVHEQKKIATFLSIIDQHIYIQSKVIEKYESLIKALYESLISCKGVNSVQLGSLVQICKGKQLNAELLSETGLYYVMNGGIFPSGYYDTYNTPQDIISISEGGNSCGYVQFNHKPFWSGGHCYTLLNPNENKVHYKYLFHFLKCHQDDIMALRIGSGLPNIQKKDIEKYPIALPKYETQVQLASLFDTINCKKENGIESLRQYKRMKSFLLSELFI